MGDPLQDLANLVRAARQAPRSSGSSEHWVDTSQIIVGALHDALDVLNVEGGIEGFIDTLKPGGAILGVIHRGKRPALVFRLASGEGVEVAYATTVERPRATPPWAIMNVHPFSTWTFEFVTRDKVILQVLDFVRSSGLLDS